MKALALISIPLILILLLLVALIPTQAPVIPLPVDLETEDWDLTEASFKEVYPVVNLPGDLDIYVPPKPHADEKHPEAPAVREFFLKGKCRPNDVKEFQGTGDMDRFRLWACEKGGDVLIYIAVKVTQSELAQGFKPWREVTCFTSRGWTYVRNLILNELYTGPY